MNRFGRGRFGLASFGVAGSLLDFGVDVDVDLLIKKIKIQEEVQANDFMAKRFGSVQGQ